MKRPLITIVFFVYLSFSFSSCILEYKTNTRRYLVYPKPVNRVQGIKGNQVVAHSLSIKYDSSDLAAYKFENRFNYTSESIQGVFEKFKTQHTGFYQQFFSHSLFSDNVERNLENMIDAKINIKRRVDDDLNNYVAFRTIENLFLKQSINDSLYHLFPEVTFRQDICIGCTRDGWQNDMHGVIHYRYAIVHGDKIVFYKEIFVPHYIDPTKKNKLNQDASLMFNEKMNDVLFYYLKKDLDKILIK